MRYAGVRTDGVLSWQQLTLRKMLQQVVSKHQCHHGLNHWNSARDHTRVMPPSCTQLHVHSSPTHCLLIPADCCCWFKCYSENNVLTIGNPPLHTTRSADNHRSNCHCQCQMCDSCVYKACTSCWNALQYLACTHLVLCTYDA